MPKVVTIAIVVVVLIMVANHPHEVGSFIHRAATGAGTVASESMSGNG